MKTSARREVAAKIRTRQFPNINQNGYSFVAISLDLLFIILSITVIGERGNKQTDTLPSHMRV
jgi:hypothetical protein